MVEVVKKRPVLGLSKKVVVNASHFKAKTSVEAANAVFKRKLKVDAYGAAPATPAVETKSPTIVAAEDGPPLAAGLPEQYRGPAPWSVQKSLTEVQVETINRIIEKAGPGRRKTLGLRLVLAASEDKSAGSWPIGLLSKALGVAGHAAESHAVYQVAMGCRTARFRDMARATIELLDLLQ
jgi:hypothetical protein